VQKVEGRKKKKFNKNGNNPTGPGVDPRPASDHRLVAQDRPATSGRPPATGRRLDLSGCPNFFEFFFFK
jgi:hypothetical protein